MHACYNLIAQIVFCMFRALNAHHQEVSCNNTGNILQCMSTYMVYIESFMCGYTGITTKVILEHIKYIQKSK